MLRSRVHQYIYTAGCRLRAHSNSAPVHPLTMATHPLLQAFRSSTPAFGVWLTVPNTWTARTAALASPHLSWLVLDCEHGLIPLQPGAAEMIAAISGLGSNPPTVLVRVPATGACADGSATWQIKYVLDAGARGVIVPMVGSVYEPPLRAVQA